MNITIIGTGYVGLVTGTCFAEKGNKVNCIDINKEKIDNLNKGNIPIYESGLEELIIKNEKAGKLFFSISLEEAMKQSTIIFIAVGTPESSSGKTNMKYVYNVARGIGKHLARESIIVSKSTVPIGTTYKLQSIIKEELDKRAVEVEFHMVSNPEFLKEGEGIEDFMNPDRVIIGTDSKHALKVMEQLYAPYTMNKNQLLAMGVKEAEFTKYVANAMLATKISFINEIAQICDELKIDIESVREGIGSDSRIGYSYINPGVGYGGSCFPKDIKAIICTAKEAGVNPILLDAVEKRNQHQKNRMFDHILDKYGSNLNGKTFTIWGLTFKPGTDDMRGAPSVCLINSLINAGAKVRAFDPIVKEEAPKQFPKEWISKGKLFFVDDKYIALENADALVLMTEWEIFRKLNIGKMKMKMKKFCMFDGRNLYEPEYVKKNGLEYKGIGR